MSRMNAETKLKARGSLGFTMSFPEHRAES